MSDFEEISVAQAVIEAAQKKISSANTGMQQTKEQQRSVSKQKRSIINIFLSQPSKSESKKTSTDPNVEDFEPYWHFNWYFICTRSSPKKWI